MKHYSQLFVVLIATLLLNAAAFSQYTQFGNLNNDSVNVTTTAVKLNTTSGTHTFTKVDNSTKIEVYVNSRFRTGAFSGGASGIQFRVRVDDTVTPNFDNLGSILQSSTDEFLSLLAVFEGLSAGSHTVSIWAQAAPAGSATSVVADPGGWGGKIIVKETS